MLRIWQTLSGEIADKKALGRWGQQPRAAGTGKYGGTVARLFCKLGTATRRRNDDGLQKPKSSYAKTRLHGPMKVMGRLQHSVVVSVISWTVLSIALSGSAFAQFQPKINLMQDQQKDPATEARKKALDDEYKSKLKAIPDQPQKKADPWANVRSSAPSSK